jgi:hypothetical protein|tara:strand:- start:6 stop:419 length:414 start_codon:yes stop_codon:yes gene_type:complete
MRSDIWLENRLETIWKTVIPEIEKQNIVKIKFKGNWKTKFGHIKRLKDGSTEIAINNLFRDKQIPDFIIDTTIAHELVHYMHGFHSPLPRLYKYPHQGNIVNKELNKRGFSFLLKLEKEWIKNKWWSIFPFLKQEIS